MIIKRGGQYKTINPSEYGIWLEAGYVKVSDGNLGDNIPKTEKKEELPTLTLSEIHETDKFVKLAEAKESVAAPHGESEVIPELDDEGCYGGVCGDNVEVEETTELKDIELKDVSVDEETVSEFKEEVDEPKPKRGRNKSK